MIFGLQLLYYYYIFKTDNNQTSYSGNKRMLDI